MASPKGAAGTLARRVNNLTGVNRGKNPMSAYYERGGTSQMGGNRRTRGRSATISRV